MRRALTVCLAAVLLLAGCAVTPATEPTEAPTTAATTATTTAATTSTDPTTTAFTATATTTAKPTAAPTTIPARKGTWAELIGDPDLAAGLKVVSVDRAQKKVFDFGDKMRRIGVCWELAQHFSRFDLITASPVTAADGSVTYENEGKRLTLSRDGGNALQMEILTGGEYDHPRRLGEEWPHLLIGQDLRTDPLANYDEMRFTMTIRYDYVENLMGDDYDPALHCYQNGIMLVVQDKNPASPGYGDYYWFGIPGFDSRTGRKSFYCNVDGGKSDASGKLIYELGGDDFYDNYYSADPAASAGKWVTVSLDILPYLEEAFYAAQDAGFMLDSVFEDIALGSISFGCECTGTFNASVSIRECSLSGFIPQ